jgi:hypothetical protein
MKYLNLLTCIALLAFIISCQKQATTGQNEQQEILTTQYAPQSVNDSLAHEIKNFITTPVYQ